MRDGGEGQVLLLPLGTLGDVLPFVAVGRALRRRGHAVVLACNPVFASLVERAGLHHTPLGDEAQYRSLVDSPRFFDRTWAFPHLMKHVGELLAPTFATVARHPSATVLAHPLALGAAVAEEKLGARLVTAHLSPAILPSAHEPPVLPGVVNGRALPLAYKRSALWAADRLLADPFIAPAFNAFRRRLGLPPATRVLRHRWSSRLHLCLFPEWFAPRQPDWPERLRFSGFPLADDEGELDDSLEPFLDEDLDHPPIVVTAGSGHRFAAPLFAAVVDAAALLHRRVLLLTRFADQLPRPLPSHVRHAAFVPLSRVLPRAAALVHHGGIGTAATALAQATPQLVVPFAHDQPDNAARLCRLGVATQLEPSRLSPRRLAAALDELTASPDVARRCELLARRLQGSHPVEDAADLLERERRREVAFSVGASA